MNPFLREDICNYINQHHFKHWYKIYQNVLNDLLEATSMVRDYLDMYYDYFGLNLLCPPNVDKDCNTSADNIFRFDAGHLDLGVYCMRFFKKRDLNLLKIGQHNIVHTYLHDDHYCWIGKGKVKKGLYVTIAQLPVHIHDYPSDPSEFIEYDESFPHICHMLKDDIDFFFNNLIKRQYVNDACGLVQIFMPGLLNHKI